MFKKIKSKIFRHKREVVMETINPIFKKKITLSKYLIRINAANQIRLFWLPIYYKRCHAAIVIQKLFRGYFSRKFLFDNASVYLRSTFRECLICYETKINTLKCIFENCDQTFCPKCFHKYIKIYKRKEIIKCPSCRNCYGSYEQILWATFQLINGKENNINFIFSG